jgi:hypothetical protein
MSKSIIKSTTKGMCYICGRFGQTEEHHIFRGKNRKRADADGLVVHLCHWCHNEPPYGVHFNKTIDTRLKQIGQRTWMRHYDKTVDDFIKAYGRNYLD